MNTFISKLRSIGTSSTAINTYLVFAGDMVFTASTFFLTILLGRGLAVDGLGVYLVLMTVLVLVNDIFDLGMGSALSHFVPHHVGRKEPHLAWSIIKTAFTFQLALGLSLSLIVFLFSGAISTILFHTTDYVWHVQITAICMVLGLLVSLTGFTLASLEKFKFRAAVTSLPAIVRLGILAVFFFSNTLTLELAFIITLIGFIPSLLVGLAAMGKEFHIARPSRASLSTLLSFSKYIGASKAVSALANRLDVLMLSAFAGPFEAGLYGAASRMMLVYPLIAGSFSSVIAPRFARLESDVEAVAFFKRVMLVALGLVSSVLVLFILAPWVVTIVFPKPEYRQSVEIFRYLLIPNALFILTLPTVNFIIYRLKKPGIITMTSTTQLVIILIMNAIFIPMLGKFGPIPGQSIAFLQVLIVSWVIVLKHLKKAK